MLRRIRVGDSGYVAGILYQSMLKAASSGDERPVAIARELDAGQHAIHAAVRASGRTPETVVISQFFQSAGLKKRRRRHPGGLDLAC